MYSLTRGILIASNPTFLTPTPTVTPTPTPTSTPTSTPMMEEDIWLASVLANGGSVETDSFDIAQDFMTQLRASTLYHKVKWLLPMLGSDLSAAVVPLIDEYSVGNSTSIGFSAGDFSQSTGLSGDGISKQFNTHLIPGATGVQEAGLGYWELEFSNTGTDTAVFGTQDGSIFFDHRWLIDLRTNNEIFVWGSPGNPAATGINPTNSNYYGQLTTASDRKIYRNGIEVASSTVSDPITIELAQTLRILGNFSDSTLYYHKGRCAVAYYTDGTLTADEVNELHVMIQEHLVGATGKVILEENVWRDAILNNGGTLEIDSYDLVQDFMTQVRASSFYEKLVFVMPLMGSNLRAGLQPLIDTIGGGVPTNTNFVDGDFSQSTGLQGNGATKILTPNIFPGSLNTGLPGAGGMGAWILTTATGNVSGDVMGEGHNPGAGSTVYNLAAYNNTIEIDWGRGGSSFITDTTPATGNIYGQSASTTSRELYKNGSLNASSSSSVSVDDLFTVKIRLMGSDVTNVISPSVRLYNGRVGCLYLTNGTFTSQEVSDFHTILSDLITASGKV